jgi:hypothetical protein
VKKNRPKENSRAETEEQCKGFLGQRFYQRQESAQQGYENKRWEIER